jgi:DNA repair protein RadC
VPRRPEQYQLAFDFGRHRREAPAVYQAIWRSLSEGGDENRFVQAVHEQVDVRSPADAAEYLLNKVFVPFDRLDQEELWLLLLNTRNRITHTVLLYRGTLNSIPVRSAEIFKEAVRVNAASVIMAHNHPSGEPVPSPEDVAFTEFALKAADVLDISLLDHILVGRGVWLSLKEKGLAFTN